MNDVTHSSRKRIPIRDPEWQQKYFATKVNKRIFCIICDGWVVFSKRFNAQRHFKHAHKQYENSYPLGTELRTEEIQRLMTKFIKKYKDKPFTISEIAKPEVSTKASFRLTKDLLKHKKPLDDGDIWKEGYIKAAEILFENFKNKHEIINTIKSISVSKDTLVRRVKALNTNLEMILIKHINECRFLSLQFSKTIDGNDITMIYIFIRMCFQDFSVKEELLTILQMKGETCGQDIYKTFKSFVVETEFPIHKLVSIMTDGAASMLQTRDGFITLCISDDDIPKFTNYHCIMHQEAKRASSIRKSNLQMCKFKELLKQCKSGELLLDKNVKCLNQPKFLQNFLDLLQDIKEYMATVDELKDQKCVMDFAFLCDITGQFNQLNLEFQKKDKTLTEMVSEVNAFKEKLSFLEAELRRGDLKHMKNMSDESTVKTSLENSQYANIISLLRDEFEKRFLDLSKMENIILYMSFPFNTDVNIEEVSVKLKEFSDVDLAQVQGEMLRLMHDIFLKSRASSTQCIWKFVDEKMYPCLWKCAARLQTFFSSTYLCQTAFSTVNGFRKQNRFISNNLVDFLRGALTTFEPQYEKLIETK